MANGGVKNGCITELQACSVFANRDEEVNVQAAIGRALQANQRK